MRMRGVEHTHVASEGMCMLNVRVCVHSCVLMYVRACVCVCMLAHVWTTRFCTASVSAHVGRMHKKGVSSDCCV